MDRLYRQYNRRKYVCPDPLQFLYDYEDEADREIVGLVASSLAYGRVAQILKSVKLVLDVMTGHPHCYLLGTSPSLIRRQLRGFKHRFTTDAHMAELLVCVRRVLKKHGSLNKAFLAGVSGRDENVLPGLSAFVDMLGYKDGHLIPDPGRGGACKRLNLYLRWMVRKDAVDPGGWSGIPRSRLIVPLDTHMAGIGTRHGMTGRKTADMKMALDITSHFAESAPRDPVKYDFALTRFGIRSDMDVGDINR